MPLLYLILPTYPKFVCQLLGHNPILANTRPNHIHPTKSTHPTPTSYTFPTPHTPTIPLPIPHTLHIITTTHPTFPLYSNPHSHFHHMPLWLHQNTSKSYLPRRTTDTHTYIHHDTPLIATHLHHLARTTQLTNDNPLIKTVIFHYMKSIGNPTIVNQIDASFSTSIATPTISP